MSHLFVVAATALNPANLALISMGIGFLLPHAIAVVNQRHWSSRTKSLVTAASCLTAALVTTWTKGTLDLQHLSESAMLIFTTARVSYAGLWQPTGIVPAIEAKTTIDSSATPDTPAGE